MLKPDQWDVIRKHYERGRQPTEISRIVPWKISRQAITGKAKEEGWERKAQGYDGVEVTAVDLEDFDSARLMAIGVIKAGATYAMAYKAIGIPESTWRDWLKDDSFRAACSQAQAETNSSIVAVARQAAESDPKYSWEWLTKHPSARDEFGQVQSNTHTHHLKLGHLIQRDPQHVTTKFIDQDD